MANKKEIKRRIRSVKNIGQITKALQMVSAVKMKKAQSALLVSNDYYHLMEEMFAKLVTDIGADEIEAMLQKRKNATVNKNVGIILITPTKGFAGSLISNLTQKTVEFIQKRTDNISYDNAEFVVFHTDEVTATDHDSVSIRLITVEKKGESMAKYFAKDILADFPRLSNPPTFEDAMPIASIFVDAYAAGDFDEVYVIYTHFLSTFSQKAVIQQLLPLNYTEGKDQNDKEDRWYSYDEDKFTLFTNFYKTYLETKVFHAILEAAASEYSARMIAMQNATDNAASLRKDLIFAYNQKRQSDITSEIAEITSASETI